MGIKMKSLLLVGAVLGGLGLVALAPNTKTAWAAAPMLAPANEMKGGGTAVLLPDGRIFDLTWEGWRAGISCPVPAKEVAILLDSSRLIAKDGTGWVRGLNNEWRSYKLPGK